MALFQKSVLNKYLKTLDDAKVNAAYKKFTDFFHNPEIIDNIREDKEEQFQYGFLQKLFDEVLDYTINPNPNYNLTTEFKNLKGAKKADGAILKDGKAVGVIELKSTKTKELVKITDQAFGYKNNHTSCNYVITSNFEKLRFYINDAVEYIDFDIFTLSEEQFKLLYLCLQKDQILSDLPLKIKHESSLQEENITKQLYKDYSAFKKTLYNDMVLNNPELDKLLLFEKSQKLLDRFLFIFFAEDKGLLPPNSISEIIKRYNVLKAEDFQKPLYDIFKQYFEYINSGRPQSGKKAEIHAYNGGLFKADDILDNIIITDAVLIDHTMVLTAYDFESEVDVNILGHIFEHSLTEIDAMAAEIEGKTLDKSKTKRKKDGVFYTPKYITKYIVDNTLGKLADAKKEVIGIKEEEYRPKRNKATKQRLLDDLNEYKEYLLSLTICDPACGSGAFLNQALDYLIKEHQYITELQDKLLGGSMGLSDVTNEILEKNIYGVDINAESVDIARLSLWLRTAKKGRTLSSLNNNIKCGNSLIDVPKLGGTKTFNWESEFPKVFINGGFDVVIGNPPYVHLETIKDESEKLSNLDYSTFDKRGDLYQLFVEKGMDILKDEGTISYIMPNKWLQAGYGKNLREYFLTKRLIQLIDFGDIQIFKGATTYPCIFIANNDKPAKGFSVSILKSTNSFDFEAIVLKAKEEFKISEFSGDTWVISSKKESNMISQLARKHQALNIYLKKGTFRGILTGLSEAFLIDESTKNNLIKSDKKASAFIHPFLQGRDIKPYVSPVAYKYLLLFEKGFTKKQIGECTEDEAWEWLVKTYPSITTWLYQFKEKGNKRTDKGDYWWEVRACDYYTEFHKPKIMYQAFQVKPCFVYDVNNLYCNNSMWIIPTDDKALVAILNSKMGWWLITKYCTQIQNGCQVIWKYFGQIPIPELSNPKLLFETEIMLDLQNNKQAISTNFTKYIQSQFVIEKLSQKLINWHELDFSDFIKELNKAIKKSGSQKLSKMDEMEWMEVFEAKKSEAQKVKAEIEKTDNEIDRLVYQLYDLTDEEIAIVEGV